MWAQSWENIYDLVAPYPDAPNPLDEVDEQLVMQVICQCQKHCTNCEASLCFLKVHIGALSQSVTAYFRCWRQMHRLQMSSDGLPPSK